MSTQMCPAYKPECGYCTKKLLHPGPHHFPVRHREVSVVLRGGALARIEQEAVVRGVAVHELALEILEDWRPVRGHK